MIYKIGLQTTERMTTEPTAQDRQRKTACLQELLQQFATDDGNYHDTHDDHYDSDDEKMDLGYVIDKKSGLIKGKGYVFQPFAEHIICGLCGKKDEADMSSTVKVTHNNTVRTVASCFNCTVARMPIR